MGEEIDLCAGANGRKVYLQFGEDRVEINPEEARELAFALMMAADDAEHGKDE